MEPYDDKHGFVCKAALSLGIQTKNLRVALAELSSPVSYGVRKKTILLPKNFDEKYTQEHQYLLLLHELAHIKNHDTLKLFLFNFWECFIRLPKSILCDFKRDTEILCDNKVIGAQKGVRDAYGDLLLQEGTNDNKVRGFAFSDSFYTLKSRLDALYQYTPEKHRRTLFTTVIPVILLYTNTILGIKKVLIISTNIVANKRFLDLIFFNFSYCQIISLSSSQEIFRLE